MSALFVMWKVRLGGFYGLFALLFTAIFLQMETPPCDGWENNRPVCLKYALFVPYYD